MSNKIIQNSSLQFLPFAKGSATQKKPSKPPASAGKVGHVHPEKIITSKRANEQISQRSRVYTKASLSHSIGLKKLKKLGAQTLFKSSQISSPQTRLQQNTTATTALQKELLAATEPSARQAKTRSKFDAEKFISQLNNYTLTSDANPTSAVTDKDYINKLPDKAKIALHKGCDHPPTTKAREAFATAFQLRLHSIPACNGSKKPITMEQLLGEDKKLLKLYEAAIEEESRSVEFRDAVYRASSEKLDENPCPDKKMVMFCGGCSAAGKSHLKKFFLKHAKKQLNKMGLGPQSSAKEPGDQAYLVAVDGGHERKHSKVRQAVLDTALSMNYSGIKDLHSHSQTHVKGKVEKAALLAGKNTHLYIPATFISGLVKYTNFIRKAAKNPDMVLCYAEIRPGKEGVKSFGTTVEYNGDSRSFMADDAEYIPGSILEDPENQKCESKDYKKSNFKKGLLASAAFKKLFMVIANPKRSFTLSNESDNKHVSKDEVSGEWVQDASNPTVKHIADRELKLWTVLEKIKPGDNEKGMMELVIRDRFQAHLGITDSETLDNLAKDWLNTLDSVPPPSSPKDLQKFLSEHNARAEPIINVHSLSS